MAKDNIKVLGDISDNTTIYRFMSLPEMMSIIETGMVKLTKVILWEDPGEYPVKWLSPDGKISEEDYPFYGSSWSLGENSDALWRIYSPDKLGVCVRSTVKKLKNAIAKENTNIEGCIAKANYSEIKDHIAGEFFGRRLSYGEKFETFKE